MSTLLEVPTFRRLALPISVGAYHLLGEHDGSDQRTELLRGFIVERMVPSPLHTTLVTRLARLVEVALAGSGAYVRWEDPLTLTDSQPQPDVAVVVGGVDDYSRAHPATALLVIEVALSTEDRDREKAALYAEANVAEYWIVLPERDGVEVYTQPQDGIYTRQRVFRSGETVTSEAVPALQVALAEFFRA